MMKTIKEVINITEEIKKSKFITFLHPISSKEDAKNLIDKYGFFDDKYNEIGSSKNGITEDEAKKRFEENII